MTESSKNTPKQYVKMEPGDPSQVPLPGRSKPASRSSSQHTPNRLPSLRGPRDLTLGGIKKKTFSPNIPVRKERVKTEVKQEAAPSTTKKLGRQKSGRQDRGRGRGRFKPKDVIQSHSIFESGPSMDLKKSGGESSYAEPALPAQKPTIKKESYDAAVEKAESEAVMKKLDEGSVSIIAGLQNDEKMKPITLPMQYNNKTDHKHIKSEPGLPVTPLLSSHCAHVFNEAANGQLLLFQLPDVLPGLPPSDDDDRQQGAQHSTKGTSERSPSEQKNGKCTLENLSEGRIGKIQIMRSGKCRLVLGNVRFDLKLGTPCCFNEELVSITLPPEESPDSAKGHVSVLGNLNHKLVCVPDMETLLGAS